VKGRRDPAAASGVSPAEFWASKIAAGFVDFLRTCITVETFTTILMDVAMDETVHELQSEAQKLSPTLYLGAGRTKFDAHELDGDLWVRFGSEELGRTKITFDDAHWRGQLGVWTEGRIRRRLRGD
jgi:hypothetical protein